MRKGRKILVFVALIAVLVCIPVAVSAAETCALGDPNGTAAAQCKGFVDTNTDGRCDRAATGIFGAAAAILPQQGNDQNQTTQDKVQEAPLPLAVIIGGVGIGYLVARRISPGKKRKI
jgi:hypothetical protein